jgi:hypothetical protein
MLCQIRRHHIEGIPGKRSGHTLERPDHEGDAGLPLMTARHEAPAGQGGQPERDKAQSPVRLPHARFGEHHRPRTLSAGGLEVDIVALGRTILLQPPGHHAHVESLDDAPVGGGHQRHMALGNVLPVFLRSKAEPLDEADHTAQPSLAANEDEVPRPSIGERRSVDNIKPVLRPGRGRRGPTAGWLAPRASCGAHR